jgi:hypothetical protein
MLAARLVLIRNLVIRLQPEACGLKTRVAGWKLGAFRQARHFACHAEVECGGARFASEAAKRFQKRCDGAIDSVTRRPRYRTGMAIAAGKARNMGMQPGQILIGYREANLDSQGESLSGIDAEERRPLDQGSAEVRRTRSSVDTNGDCAPCADVDTAAAARCDCRQRAARAAPSLSSLLRGS